MVSLYKKIMNSPIVYTQPDIDDGLKDIINSMLHKEASDRISLEQVRNHEWLAAKPRIQASLCKNIEVQSPTRITFNDGPCRKIDVTCKDIFE